MTGIRSRRAAVRYGIDTCAWRLSTISAEQSEPILREERRRDIAPGREVPPGHRVLDERPPWQRAALCGVEERIRMAGHPAVLVKAVVEAVTDSERVEAGDLIERDVDASLHPLG